MSCSRLHYVSHMKEPHSLLETPMLFSEEEVSNDLSFCSQNHRNIIIPLQT